MASFHWDAYLTLTFRVLVSFATAKRLVESWLETLGPDVYAFAAYEEGEAYQRTHVHLLLTLLPASRPKGGLNFKALRLKWVERRRSWSHGNMKSEIYDPRRGACWYLAKVPHTGEFYGKPRRQQMRGKRTR